MNFKLIIMKKILIIAVLIGVAYGFTRINSTTDKIETIKKVNDDGPTIKWMTLEQAIAAQAKKPKKIFMDAYTDWCGPCKMLDAKTFNNPDLVKYMNENYYAVKFDAEGNESIKYKGKTYSNPNYDPAKDKARNSGHQLASYFQVRAYPTMLILDEQANVLTPITGYLTPQQLEIYLKLFATNDYKNIKTKESWETYQKNFKGTFK